MALQDVLHASLNSGEISRLALARVDLAKLRVSCEVQSNFLPHVLGPCQVRPGTKFLVSTEGNAAGWLGETYFSEATAVLLVVTPNVLQILLADVYLSRPAVTAVVTNGTFDTDLAGWTDNDEAGGDSLWLTGGYMSLVGAEATYGFRDQQVTVNEVGVEHALRVVITRGTVVLKVGTAVGLAEYLDVTLAPGTYSLAFTPTGNFWIRLGAATVYASLVDSIAVEGAGTVSLPVPWASTADFNNIRYDQSGDVIFVASGYQQRRIERRASNSRSWGVALYLADDGPFRLANLSDAITLTPSATRGSINLVASRPFFKTTHAGALFRLTHSGQTASATLGAANVFTAAIRISGLKAQGLTPSSRSFAVTVDGTFVATITLQRSLGAIGSWTDVETYTAPTSKTFDDGLDNQIIFYRLGIKTGNYTSGSASAGLNYAGSSQTGIARLTSITNTQTAVADVLQEFGALTAASDWSEGEWSDYRGWPAAVALHDGRLFWEPGIKIQGSVSDAFHSFDDMVVGDSGAINRTIATGGLDGGRWLLSLQRLIAGTAAQEISIRADAFDGFLSPLAFVARVCGDAGSAKVRSLRLAKIGAYAGRSAKRLFKLIFDVSQGDYTSAAFDRLKPEMFAAGIRDLAVQRQPDNAQLWAPLGDGTAVVVTHDAQEDVEAMVPFVTDGLVERVAVLPGSDEDDVYFIIARVIGGATKRYIEKMAKRSECVGGTLSKTIDSHIVYSGAPATTLSGGAHLAGKQVVVWADGAPLVLAGAPLTVSGAGQITLPDARSNAVWGLPYTARMKTVKLAYAAEHGTALSMMKRIARVGLVMADVAWKGVRIGRDFAHLTGLAATYRGKSLTAWQVLPDYDAVPSSFNGGWDADSRVCIEVTSPYPCTIMGLVLQMTTNEPDDAGPPKKGAA